MEKIEGFENKIICAECGGICCKKSGCDYFISDFESINLNYILDVLSKENTSIIATLIFEYLKNGELVVTPILSLRARNKGRDVIDLLSMKKECASLTSDGCIFTKEERPGGGRTLIAQRNGQCYSSVDIIEETKKWLPYQNILQRVVKRYTHMTVDDKLKEDVKNLFLDILNKNCDGVSPIEISDVKSMIPSLVKCFPEQYKEAKNIYNKNNRILGLNI